jgi:hypothetical protein
MLAQLYIASGDFMTDTIAFPTPIFSHSYGRKRVFTIRVETNRARSVSFPITLPGSTMNRQCYIDKIVTNCMGDQTTITLDRSDKERLDEERGSMPWGAYLIRLLEERKEEPIQIDPAQAEEISRMTAERTVDLLEERRY